MSEKFKESIKPGKYQHYKGQFYQVLDVAYHSEDESCLVVYRPLYGAGKLWVRPFDMFCETVEVDGVHVPRFTYISDDV